MLPTRRHGACELERGTCKSRQEHLSTWALCPFMRQLIESYLAQAAEYDRRAKEATDDEARTAYRLLAEHWRYLAKQLENDDV